MLTQQLPGVVYQSIFLVYDVAILVVWASVVYYQDVVVLVAAIVEEKPFK